LHIFQDGADVEQTFASAVARDKRQPALHRFARVPDFCLIIKDFHYTQVGDIAEQGEQQVALTLPAQSADTNQFTLLHAKTNPAQ
jgi:hypothetical protein